ncbi:hypothetical protein QZH41_018301, partial [Actinostola sp. cb2023]
MRKAAVCGFQATIDGRTIVAEIQEKQEARDTYDDAISSGHSAFLLEEKRDESSEHLSDQCWKPTTKTVSYSRVDSFIHLFDSPSPVVSTTRCLPSLRVSSQNISFDFVLEVQCGIANRRDHDLLAIHSKVDINPEDNRQATPPPVRLGEESSSMLMYKCMFLCSNLLSSRSGGENGVIQVERWYKRRVPLEQPVVMLTFFPESWTVLQVLTEVNSYLWLTEVEAWTGTKIKSARENPASIFKEFARGLLLQGVFTASDQSFLD